MQRNSFLNRSRAEAVVLRKNKTPHDILIYHIQNVQKLMALNLLYQNYKTFAAVSSLDFSRFNITSFIVSESVTELREWETMGN
jgi:hypothetical protein